MLTGSILGPKICYQADPPGGGGAPPATPPPAAPPATPPASTDEFPKSWEDVFKHPRFKELNTRAQTAEVELKKLQDAAKSKTDEELKKQNEFKTLYENTQKELSAEKLTNLRLRVAASKGLPADLIDRLRGETEEDLQKDADNLLTFLKPSEENNDGKGVPPIGRGGTTPVIELSKETDPAKIREAVRKGTYK